ncbi:MAG: PGF-pre-PGF domain-containing protein [Candidatus Nanoarchaeia archaeon]|nr:PGF-pre-PGF domain-containing protein [Candidatus Nanoarchaeia archaeon]
MNKINFKILGIFALLAVFIFISSISFASAALSTISVSSNASNGSYWVPGGVSVTEAFVFNFTGNPAIPYNVTNFTITNANFTYLVATTNFSGGSCFINNTAGLVNCSTSHFVAGGGNASVLFYLNLTFTTPATATEINHSMLINVSTTESGVARNWTKWLLAVDGVAPTVTLPLYTNATTRNANSSALTLNVLVSDSGSGLTGSVCIIDVNGTNQTAAVSGGWCNLSSTTLLKGLPNGNRTMSIYANDSVVNWKLNNSLAIFADSTAPSATSTCSPVTIETEDAFPCSCSGSDALTGINSLLTSSSSTSPEGILTPTSSGVFIYSCGVTDNAGNTASAAAFTYIVNQKPGVGTPHSTSTATVTAPPHTFSAIVPGTPAVEEYADSLGIGVKEIQIEVNSEAQNVKVTVTKYDGKPAAVSVEKTGDVYQYLQINVSNVAGKLDKATITSKVNKSWVTENGLDKEDNLALFKFDETAGQWNELTTTYSSEDNTYYYYTSDVTSFSYFAIGSKSLVSGEEGAETTGEEEAAAISTMTWVWIGIGTAVLIIIIVAVLMMKRKRKR